MVDDAITGSDIVLKVQKPEPQQIAAMKEGAILISFLWAAQNRDTLDLLNKQKITALGMEAVPRITRAQKMDALSSMSSPIAGLQRPFSWALITWANTCPMMMTAARNHRPRPRCSLWVPVWPDPGHCHRTKARAVVEAFDVRPAVKGTG